MCGRGADDTEFLDGKLDPAADRPVGSCHLAALLRHARWSRPAVVYALLAAVLAVVFIPMSLLRFVDADEGTYLLVSRLVSEGQLPYHDVFYPQMYLLPYVYGVWMKILGYSWYTARLLSAAFCIALGLLIGRQVAVLTGERGWGLVAGTLFALSSSAFAWYPLVKAYAFGTLLIFAAYTVVSTRWRWRWVACGLLLGAAAACRVYLAGVLAAFVFELFRTEDDRRSRLMQLGGLAVGFAVPLLPGAVLYLVGPETFMFNVVGNQVIREQAVPTGAAVAWWDDKTTYVRMLLGLQRGDPATLRQMLVLMVVCVVALVSCVRARQRVPLASLIAIALFAVSHVPTPVYPQYFCMLTPFLLVDATVFVARLVRESTTPHLRHIAVVALAAYVVVVPLEFYRYTVTAEVIEGYDSTTDWKVSTVRAVGRSIDRHVRGDHPVAVSFWPGYFVETRAAILPGLENHFSLHFADGITRDEVAQFRLISAGQLLAQLRGRRVDVVALGIRTPNRGALRNELLNSGFVVKETVASTEIFALSPAAR
jgi:hypothetical protein